MRTCEDTTGNPGLTQAACEGNSGVWKANETCEEVFGICHSKPAAGIGACCGPRGCTEELTQQECEAAGAKYRGDGTNCAEECPDPIPTVSEWGLVVMGLLVLTAGTVVVIRRRQAVEVA